VSDAAGAGGRLGAIRVCVFGFGATFPVDTSASTTADPRACAPAVGRLSVAAEAIPFHSFNGWGIARRRRLLAQIVEDLAQILWAWDARDQGRPAFAINDDHGR